MSKLTLDIQFACDLTQIKENLHRETTNLSSVQKNARELQTEHL